MRGLQFQYGVMHKPCGQPWGRGVSEMSTLLINHLKKISIAYLYSNLAASPAKYRSWTHLNEIVSPFST